MTTPFEQSSPAPTAATTSAADDRSGSPPKRTTRQSDPPPDPAVKRALRALLDGTAPEAVDSPSTTIAAAHDALGDVEAAAAFVAANGLERLRNAAAAAERAGDREVARACQRAIARVERYRRTAAGNHFHSGRGTVFRPAGQPGTE